MLSQKKAEGARKLEQACQSARPALQLGGVAATDPRFARVATEAGVRVLEPNHTAISCARGLRGVTSMREAYQYKHELAMDVVLDAVRAIRRVVPAEVFILSAAPGTFDEPAPRFEAPQAAMLSEGGADGIFVEKNEYSEVERLVRIAHQADLLVQASCQLQCSDEKTAVIAVDTPDEARRSARRLVGMGVDIVGMRLSGIFKSLGMGTIPPEELDCLRGLADEVKGPTVVYAGVNASNLQAVASTGVKMIGIASAVDDLLFKGLVQVIDELVSLAHRPQ